MKKTRPVIAVILGDASGVGAEIVVKAFSGEKNLCEHVDVVLLGDARILHRAGKRIGKNLETGQITPEETRQSGKKPALIDTGRISPEDAPFGHVSETCGAAVIADIKDAVGYYAKGYIDGVCFAPFNKQAMRMADPSIASELDLFVQECRALGLPVKTDGGELNVVDGLWTTRVTSHIPLTQIGKFLTKEKILSKIRLANETCRQAGIRKPRIAIAALNPHGGEGGLCGEEEQTLIGPAIRQAREEGICITGLFPADTVFVHAFRGEADVVVTMYHDQGQIALKLKSFGHAVTVLAGLPLPVTTPAHGTAHDIAGKGVVSESAFLDAFAICAEQVRNKSEEFVHEQQ